jgi:predicted Zn-dependent protease
MDLDELERGFRDSPMVFRNEAITEYVKAVLCRTVGFDRCANVRVYVVNDNSFNASMAPNGLMEVHVGLLARLHSEAELAAILGHEFAHFELRHTLQQFRTVRRGTDWMAWIGLAGAATNQSVGNIQSGIIAGLYKFGRDQETAADLLGAAYVRGSPYRLTASKVWKNLILEDDALRAARNLRKVRRYYPYVTDTHPTTLQRVEYMARLEKEAADAGDQGEEGIDGYRKATAAVLPELFEGLVKGNEFGAADFVIRSRGDALGWDGKLLSIRAELYRQQGDQRDIATARQFFEKATTYSDAPPEAWRGLGLTAMRLGETDPGRAALAEYLKRVPDARDAASIRLLLEK